MRLGIRFFFSLIYRINSYLYLFEKFRAAVDAHIARSSSPPLAGNVGYPGAIVVLQWINHHVASLTVTIVHVDGTIDLTDVIATADMREFFKKIRACLLLCLTSADGPRYTTTHVALFSCCHSLGGIADTEEEGGRGTDGSVTVKKDFIKFL